MLVFANGLQMRAMLATGCHLHAVAPALLDMRCQVLASVPDPTLGVTRQPADLHAEGIKDPN